MASRSLGELTLNMVINTGSFEEGANRAERSIWKVNAELAKQQKEAERLSSKLDPVTKQLNELAKAQENISRSKELGFINPETFEKLTEQINNTRASLKSLQFNEQVDEVNKLVNKLDPAIAKYAELDAMQRQLQNGKSLGVLSGDDFDKYTRQIEQMRGEYDKVYTSAGQFAEQQNKQQIELQNILRTLDPVTAKLAELDAQQQKLTESRTAGLIDEQQYNVAIAKLNDMREAIDGTAAARAKDEVASQKQNAELQNILRTLDPVTAKLAELDMQQQKLTEGRAAGLIDEQQYTSSSARIDEMRNSVNGTTAAIEKQHAELGRLMQRLDPITHQIKELENAQELLQSSLKGGLINQGEYEKLNRELQRSKQALQDITNGSAASERSTKQLNFALQGLPAQFTDIITSLQGGQDPITVIIQQGGQLMDMFGGLGPAATVLGSYILSLITPLTAAAAAVAVLGLAYYQGSQEADAFRNALILAGNASGTTVDQLTEMARRIDEVSGTQSQAAAALAEIANSGKFAAAQFEAVAQTAVLMENATGKAISETVKDFESLAKDPVKAVVELNEKYNAFTGSIYEQITALVAQGEQQEAATLAITAYSSELDSRAVQIVENLGYIERGWKAIKDGSKEAWDEIKNVGRDKTLQEQLDAIDELIAKTEKEGPRKLRGKVVGASVESLQEQRKAMRENMLLEELNSDEKSRQAQLEKAYMLAVQENAKLIEKTLSNEQKRNKEIEKYKKNLEDIRARQPNSALLDPETVAKDLAAIEAKYKDTNKNITQDAATQYLMRLKEQEAALRGQLESSMKLSSSAKELLQFEEKIANITGKEKLTNAEKSYLLLQNQTRQQLHLNVLLEEENRYKQEALQLENLKSQLYSNLSSEQQSNNDILSAFGLGDEVASRLQAIQQIRRDSEKQQQRLLSSVNSGDISQEAYDEQLAALKNNLDQRLTEQERYYAALDDMESDWTNGARKALENYLDDARNVAGQTERLFTSAFGHISDEIFAFSQTAKLSVSSLITSVLKDMARLASNQLAAQLLGGVFSAFGGLSFGGAPAGSNASDYTGSAYQSWLGNGMSEGGFTGYGGKYEPAGVVHKGEIVWSQQDVAKAGGVNVVEAMRLGLSGYSGGGVVGGKSSGGIPVSSMDGKAADITVNVAIDNSSAASSSPGNSDPAMAQFGKEIGQFVDQRYRELINKDLRPNGQIGRAMAGGYR